MLSSARRRGAIAPPAMTLVEVLVALAVIAVLGALVIPQVAQRQRSGQAAAIANSLTGIRSAIYEFRKVVGRYPSQIAHLSTQPTAGVTDLCGRNVPIDWATVWKGPYLAQVVGTSGIPVRDAVIQNTIRRNPATLPGGTLADMLLDVTNVDQKVALILEEAFDPTTDLAAGAIRWVVTSGEQGTLTLVTPIRGC